MSVITYKIGPFFIIYCELFNVDGLLLTSCDLCHKDT